MDNLKPCPFCGAKYSAEKFTKNTVQLMEGTACFWAICLNCGVRTGEYYKPEDAAMVWNRRADDGHKSGIDAMSEQEAKAALSRLLEYVVKNTACWKCPLNECEICDVENKGRLRKYLLDKALKEARK